MYLVLNKTPEIQLYVCFITLGGDNDMSRVKEGNVRNTGFKYYDL